jgi:hypothetical protein
MPLINVVIVLIVAGVLLWLVRTYIPMAPPFPQIITAVVIIFIVLWLLSVFGVLSSVQSVRIGR